MYFTQLLKGILDPSLKITANPWIKGLCQDSRQLQEGDLFFAYPGSQADGRDFMAAAIAKKAAAMVFESQSPIRDLPSTTIPCVPLKGVGAYLGLIATRFYDYPSQAMAVIGVTGTNGKTSCTYFLAQSLQRLHRHCAMMGTLGNGFYGQLTPGSLTTPDALELQQLLAHYRQQGADTVVMEVSSHRLAQHRLNGTLFSSAGFTNLTRDHLDYHQTMARYAQAKQSLFYLPGVEHVVLNADDSYAQSWAPALASQRRLILYSRQKPRLALVAIPHVWVREYDCQQPGLRAQVITPWGEIQIENPFLMGVFNLSNLLLVLTLLALEGFSLSKIASVLNKIKGPPGRMEAFFASNTPLVIVDYAHTPDALQQVLQALRPHCRGTLYCVFGCGGDRDRGKRPLMAQVAEQYADRLLLTDDNPRFEDPEHIISEIQQGFSGLKPVHIERDRRKAIQEAWRQAQVGDIILIAGKGHEPYQRIAGVDHPFSDAIEAQHLVNGYKA